MITVALVGCMYKIVAKILSRRLKNVLHEVIDLRQSSFLEGSQLLHSVLMANETIEEVRRSRRKCLRSTMRRCTIQCTGVFFST